MICAPREITRLLSERLRQQYEVQSVTVENYDSHSICKIQAKVSGKWVTICRFSPYENLQDVLTMFKVNLQIQKRR
jgi:predicted peptidase